MRRAFTLIELLTVVAIIAVMIGGALASFGPGRKAARVKGATRDIFAQLRRARSVALVTQQASIVTYSTVQEDGETCAVVDVNTAKLFGGSDIKSAENLDGEQVTIIEEDDGESEGGETREDILFAPISSEVLKGVAIRVVKDGDEMEYEADDERAKMKISVFSTTDFLLGKLKEAKEKERKEAAEKAAASGEEQPEEDVPSAAENGEQEPVSIVWQANGRTEPHRIWVYAAGSSPEKGLCIKIDRFGGAKVLGSGEDDE